MGWWARVKEKYWSIYRQQKADIQKKLDEKAQEKQVTELNAKLKEGAN